MRLAARAARRQAACYCLLTKYYYHSTRGRGRGRGEPGPHRDHRTAPWRPQVCDKQYSKVMEFENHMSSYDHHHKKHVTRARTYPAPLPLAAAVMRS